jgi:hypothetical protein
MAFLHAAAAPLRVSQHSALGRSQFVCRTSQHVTTKSSASHKSANAHWRARADGQPEKAAEGVAPEDQPPEDFVERIFNLFFGKKEKYGRSRPCLILFDLGLNCA